MTAPRYSASAVRTIESALGIPANVHSWAITNTSNGTIKGVYRRQGLALEALVRLGAGLFVMTVLHPDKCGCPEMAA